MGFRDFWATIGAGIDAVHMNIFIKGQRVSLSIELGRRGSTVISLMESNKQTEDFSARKPRVDDAVWHQQ
jgi:hypothetical protein